MAVKTSEKKAKEVKAWGIKTPSGKILSISSAKKYRTELLINEMFTSCKVIRVSIKEIK